MRFNQFNYLTNRFKKGSIIRAKIMSSITGVILNMSDFGIEVLWNNGDKYNHSIKFIIDHYEV